jgi:hypothetical protein
MVHKIRGMNVNVEKVMLLGTPDKKVSEDLEKLPKEEKYSDDSTGDWESSIDEFRDSLGGNYDSLKESVGG